jgi:ABC-type uncharacterized transport system permease subunit
MRWDKYKPGEVVLAVVVVGSFIVVFALLVVAYVGSRLVEWLIK